MAPLSGRVLRDLRWRRSLVALRSEFVLLRGGWEALVLISVKAAEPRLGRLHHTVRRRLPASSAHQFVDGGDHDPPAGGPEGGCPRAIAPPLTLTRSMLMPSRAAECRATEANASLISIKSSSSTFQPAPAKAFVMARAGLSGSEVSGPATWPGAPTVARISSPWVSAYFRVVRTTAAAPSLSGGRRWQRSRFLQGRRRVLAGLALRWWC